MLRWIAHRKIYRSLQYVNWNKKINKINLSNLFGLLGNEIKSNKILKKEIFENKIFVENNILNGKLIALHYL